MTEDQVGIHELVIDGLRAKVQGKTVLDGVDLVVRSGEVHAIMGPNGSGKSTLSHVLMGKPGYEVLGGTVTLDGADLLAMESWQRARAGLFLAPQYPTEVPGVGFGEMLVAAMGSRSDRGEAEVDRRAGIESTRLGFADRLLDRSVNVDLSGGERKRSEIVQMAVLRPAIAVLDEIDSGLDVDGLTSVATRVREAVSEWGLGVLAITHYKRLLNGLRPDTVHVFVGGRIVRTGGPEIAAELEETGYPAPKCSRTKSRT